MTPRRIAHWTVALTFAVVGAGCGGGDDDAGGDGNDDGNDDGSTTAGRTGESLDPLGGPDDPSSDIAPEPPAEVGLARSSRARSF